MASLQANIPGVAFRTTGFSTHHGRSLAHWDMLDGRGTLLAEGSSYLLHAADGRLLQMNGFFQVPPAG
jgi:hypothetical protein